MVTTFEAPTAPLSTAGGLIPTTVVLQSDPGGKIIEHARSGTAARLGDRDGLVLAVAALRDAPVEERGIGACYRIAGHSVLDACLLVPRNVTDDVRREIEAVALSRKVSTPLGERLWKIETWEDFCHPFHGALRRTIYTAQGPLITFGIGRTVSLLSDVWRPAHGRYEGGWTFYPAGWDETVVDERGRQRLRSVSPHLPPIRVKAVGEMGDRAEFARPPGGPGYGKRNPDGSHCRGVFIDLFPPAFTLDGIERRQPAEHLEAFGLPALDLPAALPIDAESAEHLVNLVESEHALAVLLDEEVALWLTTPERRRRGQSVLDLTRLRPGVLAAEVLRTSGIRPPGVVHDVPQRIQDAAIGASHGGQLSSEGVGLDADPAVDIDISTAYIAAFKAAGGQDYIEAAGLSFEDVREELRACLAGAAAGDVSLVFDRDRTRWLASVVAEIVPDGDFLPVATTADELPGFHSWRMVRRATGTRPVLPFTGPDLYVSALRTARAPEITWAVAWRAEGKQPGVKEAAPLYGGMRAGLSGPVVGLAALRNRQKRAAKAAGDSETAAVEERRAASSRLVGLAAAYGLFGHTTPGTEERGEWWAPIIFSEVTSTVRMWIAVAEHLLAEHGITVKSRDTDGLLLCCTPAQWDDLDAVLHRFSVIDPFEDGTPFWKVLREHDGRPLWAVVLRLKRYVIFTRDDDGPVHEVVEFTEHALAGSVADPPCLSGRLPNGKHRWALEVAEDAARRSVDPDYKAPFHEWADFPMIGRHEARSVATFTHTRRALPGLRPFGRYLRAQREYAASPVPFAVDNGSDLQGWGELEWHALGGAPLAVFSHREDDPIVEIRTLHRHAVRWRSPRSQDTSPIVVDPDLIRLAGRAGPALDALRADNEADPNASRKVYRPENGRPIVERIARKYGKRVFGRMAGLKPSTAGDVANGKASDATIRRALAALGAPASLVPACETEDCNEAIGRAGKRFCNSCAKNRQRVRSREYQRQRAADEKAKRAVSS